MARELAMTIHVDEAIAKLFSEAELRKVIADVKAMTKAISAKG